jgi:hypothetical protein
MAALAVTMVAGQAVAGWSEVEFRGGVNIAEFVFPLLGETTAIQPRVTALAGVGWRHVDEDGSQDPAGFFLAGSMDVSQHPFSWVEFGGGLTYKGTSHLGIMLRAANDIEETQIAHDGLLIPARAAIAGVDWELKTVFGFGQESGQ